MNTLIKSAVVIAGLSLSFGASAKSDAGYLSDCRASIKSQFESVSKVDVANIKSRRNLFKAKFKVKADGKRSLVLCEIRDEKPVALNCLKGDICSTSSIASN